MDTPLQDLRAMQINCIHCSHCALSIHVSVLTHSIGLNEELGQHCAIATAPEVKFGGARAHSTEENDAGSEAFSKGKGSTLVGKGDTNAPASLRMRAALYLVTAELTEEFSKDTEAAMVSSPLELPEAPRRSGRCCVMLNKSIVWYLRAIAKLSV